MDKSLIKRFLAWSLITFGSFMTAGFLIVLSDGWAVDIFWAWMLTGVAPLIGGTGMIRGVNQRTKRLIHQKSERDILRLAAQNQGRLTAHDVAMNTPLSLDESKQKLNTMQENGHVHLEVSEQGAIVYLFPALLPDGKEGGERL